MRKILLGLTIVVLLIVTVKTIYKGTAIGNIGIWGISQITEKNADIDEQNSKLTNLTNVSFPEVMSTLSKSSELLQQTKKQYEEKAILLANNKYYGYKEKYMQEFILTKIGNYADDEGVDTRIVVTNSETPTLYDINFTVKGKYIDVADYIYDIENDSKLGFKIEDFIMVSFTEEKTNADGSKTNGTGVKANFNCKEIAIDLKWLDENESVIPGIVTRGNPFKNSMTTLTGKYADEEEENNTTTNETAQGNTTANTTNSNSSIDTTNTSTSNENTTNSDSTSTNESGTQENVSTVDTTSGT